MFRPTSATFLEASLAEALETSNATIMACGLFFARGTVWAPTPQPASRTRDPGAKRVSQCSISSRVEA